MSRHRLQAQSNAAQRDKETVSAAFRRVFATPEGIIVLDEVLRMAGVDAPLFHVNPDARTYNLARRDFGLEIWKLATGERITSNPEVKTHE